MFAWAPSAGAAAVLEAMRAQFARESIPLDEWIVEIQSAGARVVA
jgi:hypothetical protein